MPPPRWASGAWQGGLGGKRLHCMARLCAGRDNLSVSYKGVTWSASLLRDGTIEYNGGWGLGGSWLVELLREAV